MTADAESNKSTGKRAIGAPGKVQMNVYLPPTLVRRVKHKAVDDETSLSNLVEQALLEYLRAHEGEGR